MQPIDQNYCGIPWKDGGRSRAGLDCAGLAQLWLMEQMGLSFAAPESADVVDAETLLQPDYKSGELERGDIVFLRVKTGQVRHVAIYLGNNRYLHIVRGYDSRIEIGTKLMERCDLSVAGAISAKDAERLCLALLDPKLGDYVTLAIGLAISLALTLASSFLLRPKKQNPNLTGRYGFDSLATQTSSELPLPDVLGSVMMAGNSPYQTLVDKSQTVTDLTTQKANFVVVLASGPIAGFDQAGIVTTINGTLYDDPYFFNGNAYGICLNPAQDENDAEIGNIGPDTNRPSFTVYTGAHDITVPVDIRAQFDRDFPVYGFSGCAYYVFRLINSNKFNGFNLNTYINARQFRTFNSSGFIITTVTNEAVATGDGSTTRFKLDNWDLVEVTAVTVGGTSYTHISATNQTGNVFHRNLLKGYLEFPTAPTSGAAIVCTYTYYPRTWSNNPATHLVYLLTEPLRGKGLPASKINWPSFVALYNYCAASITWVNANGTTILPRYTCNYAIDSRKPIQDHIQAVLDSCYSYLFLSGGQFYTKPRMSESAVMDFNMSNIIAGSFSAEKIDRSNQANRIHMFFRATDTYNEETEIIRDNQTDQRLRAQQAGDNGIIETVLHVPAIDNQPQAERYSEQLLRESVYTRWTCQFTTNIKGLAIQPGDVITVTHPAKPSWQQKLFRVEEHNYDENDQLTLNCSEYFDGAYI